MHFSIKEEQKKLAKSRKADRTEEKSNLPQLPHKLCTPFGGLGLHPGRTCFKLLLWRLVSPTKQSPTKARRASTAPAPAGEW
jgi:hypothetical protein